MEKKGRPPSTSGGIGRSSRKIDAAGADPARFGKLSQEPSLITPRMSPGKRKEEPVTVKRLDRCIKIVASWIVEYNMPEAIHALNRLEAARDVLLWEGDAIDYAKKVLARSGEDTSK